MTTREEYLADAEFIEQLERLAAGPADKQLARAARVLRQLAEGAVLCHYKKNSVTGLLEYVHIEEQP